MVSILDGKCSLEIASAKQFYGNIATYIFIIYAFFYKLFLVCIFGMHSFPNVIYIR